MVLFPVVVETSPFFFVCLVFCFSQSEFTERGKEKGSSEREEDRCEDIPDPSNSVVCLSLLDICNSVCTIQFYDRNMMAEEKYKE